MNNGVKPKLGFAGIGWIGKNRLMAISEAGKAEIEGIVDPDPKTLEDPDLENIEKFDTLEEMLQQDLDAIVIATPSAMHANQAITALKRGKAVFCQKPLGIDARETTAVVETARRQNLLLEVDFSYRFTEAAQQLKKLIQSGELGKIYAVHLTFHNAYGPDKSWYYNFRQSGGGCLMDLGIHLVDLLFWVLGEGEINNISSHLYREGQPLQEAEKVEDYASAQFSLNGTVVQLNCSWNQPIGEDADIKAAFYGKKGGAAFRNTGGSFYDFTAERFSGTATEILVSPPDNWGGRAAVEWSKKLAENNHFDPAAQRYVDTARALDLIYQNSYVPIA